MQLFMAPGSTHILSNKLLLLLLLVALIAMTVIIVLNAALPRQSL